MPVILHVHDRPEPTAVSVVLPELNLPPLAQKLAIVYALISLSITLGFFHPTNVIYIARLFSIFWVRELSLLTPNDMNT